VRYCSVDRIEGGTAVLLFDDGEERAVKTETLAFSVNEGLIIRETKRGFRPDARETERRRAAAAELFNRLRNR